MISGKQEVIRQFFICIENTHNTNTKKGFPNFLLALDTVENKMHLGQNIQYLRIL